MSKIFPSAAPTVPPPTAAGRPWRRVAVFALGLGLLWLLLQILPPSPPPTAPTLYRDDAGTVATEPPAPDRTASRSLITPGYLLALALLAGGGLLAWHLRSRTAPGRSAAGPLRPLGQMPLGPNQHLRLVACGGEVLLLGVTASEIRLLTSFPAADFAATGTATGTPAGAAAEAPTTAPATPLEPPRRADAPAASSRLRRVFPPSPDRPEPSFEEILRTMTSPSSR